MKILISVLMVAMMMPFSVSAQEAATEEAAESGEYSAQTLRRFQGAAAQTPDMPVSIQALVSRGAQARYLGFFEGMHGWMTIQQGRPAFYYVTPNGNAIIRGFMFDKSGEMVTGEQITQLKMREGAQMMALSDIGGDQETAGDLATNALDRAGVPDLQPVASPEADNSAADSFFQAVNAANGFVIGDADKPLIHAFIDPNCEHCRQFIRAIIPYIDQGFVALRVIPVGFDAASRQRAAFLLSAANPGDRLSDYVAGDDNALEPLSNVAEDGILQNIRVMGEFRLDVTPIVIYSTSGGQPQIIRGLPKNTQKLVSDVIKG